jgi:hypothetical protein
LRTGVAEPSLQETKMFSREICRNISFALVGTMVVVAWSEMQHGALPSDVHLITNVQLATSLSTSVTFGGAPAHENTIMEAQYVEPARTSPLPHDGLTHPSTF